MDGSASPSPPPPPRLAPPRFAFTPAQTRLMRLTVARACTDAEFDHFIAVAERAGLDPLRRQINALILNAHDASKRTMLPQAGIDGLRAIAARHGDYRPMESPPEIEIDADRIDAALNPLGIVRAKVVVWKRFDAAWFAIAGEAWWDEYAPRGEGIGASAASEEGNAGASQADHDLPPAPGRQRGGRARAEGLAANWRRMGRVMICKCAEAQALRRGWPEDLSGLYSEEELHRTLADDQAASDRVRQHEAQMSAARLVGGNALMFSFGPGAPLERVARADVSARLAAFVRQTRSAVLLDHFLADNAASLRLFWDWDGAAAFAFKQHIDKAAARLRRGKPDGQTPAKRPARARLPQAPVAGAKTGDH